MSTAKRSAVSKMNAQARWQLRRIRYGSSGISQDAYARRYAKLRQSQEAPPQ